MQNAIVKFDDAQKEAQGGLRLIDIFYFAGTIVASGPSCSEQDQVDGYLNHLILLINLF